MHVWYIKRFILIYIGKMETFLDNVANESRELRMEDTLPSIQIGLMGILAVYGFVTLFFRLTGASSRSGGDDLFNIFSLHDYRLIIMRSS